MQAKDQCLDVGDATSSRLLDARQFFL